jgi:hypothetical protein
MHAYIMCILRQAVEEAGSKCRRWEAEKGRRLERLQAEYAALKQRAQQEGLNVDACKRERDMLERDIRECQACCRVN